MNHNWIYARGGSGWECSCCGAVWPPEEGKFYSKECIDWLRVNANERDRNYTADDRTINEVNAG